LRLSHPQLGQWRSVQGEYKMRFPEQALQSKTLEPYSPVRHPRILSSDRLAWRGMLES